MPQMGQTSNLGGTQAVMSGQQTASIVILGDGQTMQNTANSNDSSSVLANKLLETQQTGVQSNMNMSENSGSVPANTRVKFKIDHFKKLALQPLEFDVLDPSGKAYTDKDLQNVNGQLMHFIVVSADLREFQHLHPTFENGKWKVLANLPTVGTYYSYVDITPVKGDHVVLRSSLIVQKETTDKINYPGLTPNLFAITKNYKAQLALSQALVLQQSVLAFDVSLNGKATALSPYLGAVGHVTIFRQGNVDSYTHIHPLSSSNATTGHAEFMTTFVKGGRYTAFAEFQIGKTVYTFPITFDISG